MTPASPARLPQFLASLDWPLRAAQAEITFGTTTYLDQWDHYDATLCLLNARDLAASPHGLTPAPAPASTWTPAIEAAFARYGPGHVIPRGGAAWHHAYATGAARLYEETRSRDALAVVRALNPTVPPDALADGWRGADLSREVAFMLLDCLAADRAGLGENARVDTLAALALGHLEQWSRPTATRCWATMIKPFMVGLTCLALIRYHESYPPDRGGLWSAPRVANLAAIPDAIARCLDHLWATCWMPTHPDWPHGAFTYMDLALVDRPPLTDLCVVEVLDDRTFRGPDTLDARDDYYDHVGVAFDQVPGDKFRCVGYAGATRTFTLSSGYHPPLAGRPDDDPPRPSFARTCFDLHSLIDPDGGPGPTPDLNHLIAPAYAWVYARTGEAKWRERYDAAFDGGTMAHGPPTAHKQWNQALLWGGDGLEWRAEGARKEDGAASPPVDPPVDPPTPQPPRTRKFKVTMRPEVPMTVEVPVDGRKKSIPVAFEVDGVRIATTMRIAVDESGKVQGFVADG